MRFCPELSGGWPGLWRRLPLVAAGCLALMPVGAGASGPSFESLTDAVLRKSYPADGPGAAVVVVRHGRVLLRKGFGLSDLGRRTPVDPGDLFRIGSITKQFTAVSILQLEAAGKLRLDDAITDYVPEFDAHGRRITLVQLLTHTSGIPNYTADPGFRAVPQRDLSLAQILGFIRDKPPNFAPGSQWAYCNTGYILLGAVIEKVSGQSYDDYLREHVFAPAGLTHTVYGHARQAARGQIQGYSRAPDGAWVKAEYLNSTQAYSAGALVSDVDDLLRWEEALGGNKLLRPDLLALARAPARFADGQREAAYGLGWELGNVNGQPYSGHGGTISGFRTFEMSVPSLGLYVAILCNADRPRADPEQVAGQIARLAIPPGVAIARIVPRMAGPPGRMPFTPDQMDSRCSTRAAASEYRL